MDAVPGNAEEDVGDGDGVGWGRRVNRRVAGSCRLQGVRFLADSCPAVLDGVHAARHDEGVAEGDARPVGGGRGSEENGPFGFWVLGLGKHAVGLGKLVDEASLEGLHGAEVVGGGPFGRGKA